jgi:hypothetical protein
MENSHDKYIGLSQFAQTQTFAHKTSNGSLPQTQLFWSHRADYLPRVTSRRSTAISRRLEADIQIITGPGA